VLRAVQQAREATERVIAATRELKKSLMRHLFTYGPVPVDQADQVPMQETELGPIPAHWRVVKLGEVFKIFAGGDITRLNWSPVRTGKFVYPIYSNSLEKDGLYGFADSYKFPANSITVTGRGNLGYAVHRCEKFNAIIRLLVLVPEISLDAKFVAEYINAFIRVNFEGSSIPQLTRPKIAGYSIPLPPLSEQREITRILQAVERKIEAEEARKQALEALFKTLLHELMTARRRLPADFVAHFATGAQGLAPQPMDAHTGNNQ
jgi:type I restriction enzyme S subunit